MVDYNGEAAFSYDGLDRVAERNSVGFSYTGMMLDPAGDGSFTYSRSPAGRLVSQTNNGTGEVSLIGLDRHGDLTWLANPGTGDVTGTFMFDPYGDPTATIGDTTPTVGFQGDYTDPASGEVWMGARWYSGSDAVFRSRDTVFGELSTPISLNRYTYAWANPLTYWDPDGRTVEYIPGLDGPDLDGMLGDVYEMTHVTTSEGNLRRGEEAARQAMSGVVEQWAEQFSLPTWISQPLSEHIEDTMAAWLQRVLNNPWMVEVYYYGQFLGGRGRNHMFGVGDEDPRAEFFLQLDEYGYFEAGNAIDSITMDLLRAGTSLRATESFYNAPCRILDCSGGSYTSPFPQSRGESAQLLTTAVIENSAMMIAFAQWRTSLTAYPTVPGYSSGAAPIINEGYGLNPWLQPATEAAPPGNGVTSPLWTSTKNLSAPENAFRHFGDHGADFPRLNNSVEYVADAQSFLRHPPPGTRTIIRTNGDIVRYNEVLDVFGVMDAGGAPRTYFVPDPAVHGYATNLDYFLSQGTPLP
jgi:RHS repeat-associated protein